MVDSLSRAATSAKRPEIKASLWVRVSRLQHSVLSDNGAAIDSAAELPDGAYLVDLSRVRIGMQVLLFAQERTVARGIVEDLGNGRATARVLQSFAGQVSVARNARVEFTDALQGKSLK